MASQIVGKWNFLYLGPLRARELKVSWAKGRTDSRERASQKGENLKTAGSLQEIWPLTLLAPTVAWLTLSYG